GRRFTHAAYSRLVWTAGATQDPTLLGRFRLLTRFHPHPEVLFRRRAGRASPFEAPPVAVHLRVRGGGGSFLSQSSRLLPSSAIAPAILSARSGPPRHDARRSGRLLSKGELRLRHAAAFSSSREGTSTLMKRGRSGIASIGPRP